MKLTPMDINNKEFKRGIRGYNPDEVDEFLDEVVENYEELYKENSRLKETVTRLKDKVDHYKRLEATIQNTLLLAQNAAEQAKESSQKEADLIVNNANETAQKILDKAHSDVIGINDEYERVKEEFIKFRAKFRGFMNTQLQTFDELEKDLTKNYNVSEVIQELELGSKEIETKSNVDEESESNTVKADDISEIKSFFAKN